MDTKNGVKRMFDTNVTIVGNVVTKPEWRRTDRTKSLVAHFKVASTARRFDKDNNRWADGNSLRVRVTCWRGLADGVCKSLAVGDPIVVVGRMYTRDWISDDQQHRVSYELEAYAVGHDLSRGTGTFTRRKAAATVAVEDAEAEERIGGETTHPVPSLNTTRTEPEADPYDYQDDVESFPLGGPAGTDEGGAVDEATRLEAMEILRGAGLDAQAIGGEDDQEEPAQESEPAESAARGRRRGRQTVAA
ncbi:single-stranded DNA-binding protein [Luedemannella helvata]|uniref:Single-stranded DNA-binding protein n=1 Tax=Luedemannella helvata TaxID=349315 RepID=A0ABN2KZF9_9ACTN